MTCDSRRKTHSVARGESPAAQHGPSTSDAVRLLFARRRVMPTPSTRTKNRQHTCSCEVLMDRFDVNYGHKERSSAQLRLEGDGSIYLNDTRGSRYPEKHISATVPFKLFIEEWPRFIQCLAAKAHERAETALDSESGG